MKYDDVTTNPIWRTAAILKIVFGYISTIYRPINAKFGKKKHNHGLRFDLYKCDVCFFFSLDIILSIHYEYIDKLELNMMIGRLVTVFRTSHPLS